MNNPLISIIIPVYNGEKTLHRTLESCFGQTYSNYEIIVIDNASTDGTKAVVDSFSSEQIRYIYLSEKGRSRARNAGIDQARGEYIQFLDADDMLDIEKLAHSMKLIKKAQVLAVQCATVYHKDGKEVKRLQPYVGRDFYKHLVVGNTIPIHSIVVAKSLCGRFPTEVDYCEDWVFWLEALQYTPVAVDADYTGAIVVIHATNTMGDLRKMKDYELRVLMQYGHIRLPLKLSFCRFIKIVKRYIEYCVCSEQDDAVIEKMVWRRPVFTVVKLLSKLRFIKNIVVKRAQRTEKASIYEHSDMARK